MLKALIHKRLDAYEREYGYDVSYVREILDADLAAFRRVFALTAFSAYAPSDVPAEAQFAAKITGTLTEDCGPCTQLMVTQAERAGVAPDTIRAVVRGDLASLGPDARLAVLFARAVLAHDPEADVLRAQVRERWGRRGVIALAFGLVSARAYPTLKYALGFAKTCSRVVVAGDPVSVQQQAHLAQVG
jgi:hypothetical protein